MAVDLHAAAVAFKQFMVALGHDPDYYPDLFDTPERVAKMYAELLGGGDDFEMTTFDSPWSNMVVQRNIPFSSLCSHHFLPFQGVATVGYIPKQKIIGLSKIARIVGRVAAKPQTQEEMVYALSRDMINGTKSVDVAVVVVARHMCMEIRGVKAHGSDTAVASMNGAFKDNISTREEFYRLGGIK